MTDMLDSTKIREDLDKNVKDTLNEAVKEVDNQNPIVDDASATLQEPNTSSNNSTSSQQGTQGNRNTNQQQEQPENSVSSEPTESTIKYPNIESDFFKGITSKKNWWEDNKLFFAFGLLVLLAGFVLYKVICENLCEYQYSSSYLFFLFGIITMLFVVLGVLAYFIIKESAKHRSEKDERENKQLAFRQKMIETVFGLENRNLIDEKQKQEKTISKDEKEVLYSLDENLRRAEHNRKMQLRKYDFLEKYLNNEFELAKISEKNSIKLGKDFEATMTNPIEKIEKVPKSGEEKEYYKITFEKDK